MVAPHHPAELLGGLGLGALGAILEVPRHIAVRAHSGRVSADWQPSDRAWGRDRVQVANRDRFAFVIIGVHLASSEAFAAVGGRPVHKLLA